MDMPTTGTVEAPEAPPVITQEQLDAAAKRAVDAVKGDTKGPSALLPSIRAITSEGVALKIQSLVWNRRDMVVTASRYEGKDHADNFDGMHVTAAFCKKFGLDESETARVLAYRAKADDLLINAI